MDLTFSLAPLIATFAPLACQTWLGMDLLKRYFDVVDLHFARY